MTTLNARANQAYADMEAELAQDDCAAWFISERDAWEDGWETGYKARLAEETALPGVPVAPDATGEEIGEFVREFADKHGIPLPEDDDGCKGEGRGTGR